MLVFMIVTGFAPYGEGTGMGAWQYEWFSAWVIPLMGQSQDVHIWHHLMMWAIVCFVIIHVYVAIREDIMSRQSLIGTMISGWRMFKDSRDVDDGHWVTQRAVCRRSKTAAAPVRPDAGSAARRAARRGLPQHRRGAFVPRRSGYSQTH